MWSKSKILAKDKLEASGKLKAPTMQAQKAKASSALQKLRAARLEQKEALTASGTKLSSKGKTADKMLNAATEETKHETTHTASLMARLGINSKHEDEAEDESKDAVLEGLKDNDAHVRDDFGFSDSLSKLTGTGTGGLSSKLKKMAGAKDTGNGGAEADAAMPEWLKPKAKKGAKKRVVL